MKLADLEGKRILLLGYGMEGRATERFLRARLKDPQIMIADQKDGPDYLTKQENADVVIRSPGIPRRLVTKPCTTGTNLFFETVTDPVIGVTGSKGKSTTAALIAAMLTRAGKKVRLVGNIGHAALDSFLDPPTPDEIFVFELSSYQLEDIEYSPHIAVFTTFFPEHLTYHGDLDAYFAAKANIIQFAKPDDLFIYNPNDARIAALAGSCPSKTIPFVSDLPFSAADAKLKGVHNLLNIRAAYTVVQTLGVDADTAAAAVRDFEPLPHRLTDIGTFHGIRFVDDAISTAPESTAFAIETVGNVGTIFLGGEDRGVDFSLLAQAVKQAKITNIVLFPPSGERIASALDVAGCTDLNILKTSSMEEAVRFAFERTDPGKACLLSTASPSYSLWKNFEAKGDDFTAWVTQLGGSSPPTR